MKSQPYLSMKSNLELAKFVLESSGTACSNGIKKKKKKKKKRYNLGSSVGNELTISIISTDKETLFNPLTISRGFFSSDKSKIYAKPFFFSERFARDYLIKIYIFFFFDTIWRFRYYIFYFSDILFY